MSSGNDSSGSGNVRQRDYVIRTQHVFDDFSSLCSIVALCYSVIFFSCKV